VLAGLALFSMDEGEAVIRRYRDWAADLPDSVSTIIALRTVPPIPAFPSELHGRRVVGIVVCDATGEGADAIAAVPTFGKLLVSSITRKPFVAHQASFDPTVPPGLDYYWKSHFLAGLPDDAIDAIVDKHRRTPTTWSYSLIPQLGGAISRVPEAATAYANRSAPFAININGVGTEPGEHDRTVPWVREVFEALKPFSTGGVYVNFLGDEGEDRIRAAYGSAYDRLAAIKAQYDPANVFRTNQNVPPARST
jgi:hypothetical protein